MAARTGSPLTCLSQIDAFARYISPSDAEVAARHEAIGKVSQAVRQEWPHARVKPFGSHAAQAPPLPLPQAKPMACCHAGGDLL